MTQARVGALDIEYELSGSSGPLVVLVMGLGQQLSSWPDPLVSGLVHAGFRVLRFDNRDTGYSSKIEGRRHTSVPQAFLRHRMGWSIQAPYDLEDMATDAFGLVDLLGEERFHVVGVSMGGMIAQIMASRRPDRVLTLTSIMSTSGERHLPAASPRALALLASRPAAKDRDARIAFGVKAKRILAGPAFPTSEEEMERATARNVDRMWYPPGYARHTLAVLASPDRAERLRVLDVPTLVYHGRADPLVPVGHGERVAELVPGAKLRVVAGWGHDLPPGMVPILVDAVAEHAGQRMARVS